MKRIGIAALVFALAPTLVSAQAQSPQPPPAAAGATAAESGPDAQRFAAMQQFHAQARQIHEQARAQTLAALSPQHRTLVANVIGAYAVASNPDAAATARQIDALLSPGEKQAVLNIHATAKASMQNLMAARRAQFEASMSAEQRAQMQQHMAQMRTVEQTHPQATDAGSIVLHLLSHAGGPGEGMHIRPM